MVHFNFFTLLFQQKSFISLHPYFIFLVLIFGANSGDAVGVRDQPQSQVSFEKFVEMRVMQQLHISFVTGKICLC